MISFLAKSYRKRPHAEAQRAKLLFTALIAAAFACIASFLLDLNDGIGTWQEAAFFNLALLPFLGVAMWLTARGYFRFVATPIIVLGVLIFIGMSVWVGQTVHPESFYQTTAQFFSIPLLMAALLTNRKTMVAITGSILGWMFAYWWLYCDILISPIREQAITQMSYTTVMLVSVSIFTLAMVTLFGKSIQHTQDQLAINNKLKEELEMRVQVRTRELELARNAALSATQAKSDFLANMSHEIRTPLSGILGITQLLARRKLNEDEQEYVSIIQDSGKHLLSIVQDVLDYSKIEAGRLAIHYAPLSLKSLLQSVSDLLGAKALEKKLYLKVHSAQDIPPMVLSDDLRLRQVLLNLVGNALKFTHQGGVTLRLDLVSRTESSCKLRFQVQDTGIGMNSDAISKVLERYVQAESDTSQQYGGTGLGLSISRSLLLLMDSDLQIQSELGQGTLMEFTLLLEEYNPNLAKSPTEEVVYRDVSGRGTRVLVAEDNPLNCKLAQRILERMEFTVQCVENGEDVLEIMRKDCFDLVLMDCHMPILDGLAATQTIRSWAQSSSPLEKAASKTIIIGLSADAQPQTRERCLQAGMNDYLTKPFQLEVFSKTVAHWL